MAIKFLSKHRNKPFQIYLIWLTENISKYFHNNDTRHFESKIQFKKLYFFIYKFLW